VLEKKYFSGGTVEASLSGERFVRFKPSPHRYEDGTQDYLALLALPIGFKQIGRLGMEAVSRATKALAQDLHACMGSLRHANGMHCPLTPHSLTGASVCRIYGYFDTQNPTFKKYRLFFSFQLSYSLASNKEP
jgi:selenocysteine lyase/cysteine desulfurase